MLAGAIGGATAGAVNTAINGGNFAANVFGGAFLGGVAGGLFGPLAGAYGGGWTGAIAAGAATGAVVGGLGTAIYGGKFGQTVGFGALGGAVTAAAFYGGYKGLGWLQEQIAYQQQTSNARGLGGLQFADASRGDVMSDAPRFAGSTDIVEVWEKVMGPLEKAGPVAGAASAASMGAALMTSGLYLIQQSFGLVPTAGPIAAGLTAAAGLVTLGGGFALEVGAVYMGYELFIKPNPRVPGTVSGGK